MSAKDAVMEAGRERLRPILMTTFTMIVGMLPTALAVTAGSETRSSMSWVIIGGLLTSTVFTLLVIPIIFLFFENTPCVPGSPISGPDAPAPGRHNKNPVLLACRAGFFCV